MAKTKNKEADQKGEAPTVEPIELSVEEQMVQLKETVKVMEGVIADLSKRVTHVEKFVK